MTPKDVHVARDVHLADAESDALINAFFSTGVLGVAQVLALGAAANDPRDSEPGQWVLHRRAGGCGA
jgi:hypothetical protein